MVGTKGTPIPPIITGPAKLSTDMKYDWSKADSSLSSSTDCADALLVLNTKTDMNMREATIPDSQSMIERSERGSKGFLLEFFYTFLHLDESWELVCSYKV